MALKPNQITRRNFVQRAGLLVTSLGVAGGIQSGLMDNIIRRANKKWGGEALAAAGEPIHYVVELCFRAGFQFNSLFPSMGHTQGGRGAKLNVYSSQNMIDAYKPNANAKDAYIARYGANVGGDRLLQVLNGLSASGTEVGVATSETISLINGNHTADFKTRAPNTNAPCPAALHRSLAPASAVGGIDWNNGSSVTNRIGSLAPLSRVRDREEFDGLFRDLPTYFTMEELQLIVGEIEKGSLKTAGAIDDLDRIYLAKQVPGAENVAQVSLAGRGQAQLKLLDAVNQTYNANAARFTSINEALGGTQLGIAMNSAMAAFGSGGATSFTVAMNSGDWHGDINALDSMNGKQGRWNTYVGNALAGFLDAAANTVDFHDPTKRVIDSLLISMSSEFTRTPNRNGGGSGGDNGDGGTQAFVFIGTGVNNGSYGNITPTGTTRGFDPVTGNTIDAAPNLSEASVWKAAGELMGVPKATLDSMVAAPSIPAVVKSV